MAITMDSYVYAWQDQQGKPRAWGSSKVQADAIAEADRQRALYEQEHPDNPLVRRVSLAKPGDRVAQEHDYT